MVSLVDVDTGSGSSGKKVWSRFISFVLGEMCLNKNYPNWFL